MKNIHQFSSLFGVSDENFAYKKGKFLKELIGHIIGGIEKYS